MSIVNRIIEGVGTKRFCQGLDVLPTTVSNAKAAQAFPARWFLVVRAFAVEVGVDVESPDFLDAFTFIEPDGAGGLLSDPAEAVA